MLAAGNSFPYKPIRPGDYETVMTNLGGKPVVERKYLREFMKLSGFPVIGTVTSYFVGSLAQRSLSALDIESPEAIRSFNGGALFYAGVVGIANGQTREVPFDSEVLAEIKDSDPQNFAIETLQYPRLEDKGFLPLLEEVRPAMGTVRNPALHDAAMMGAGTLHFMLVRSVDKLMEPDPAEFMAGHPELDNLEGFGGQ